MENRVRVLFSELRFEDELLAPKFACAWSQARSKRAARRTTLKLARATAVIAVCVALCSLVLVSTHRLRQRRPDGAIATGPTKYDANPPRLEPPQQVGRLSEPHHQHSNVKQRYVRWSARAKAARVDQRRLIKTEALAISRWQSPTANLLHSYSEELLKSLPPLNQTLRELKSFLPAESN